MALSARDLATIALLLLAVNLAALLLDNIAAGIEAERRGLASHQLVTIPTGDPEGAGILSDLADQIAAIPIEGDQ